MRIPAVVCFFRFELVLWYLGVPLSTQFLFIIIKPCWKRYWACRPPCFAEYRPQGAFLSAYKLGRGEARLYAPPIFN
ncbi:uncharacterized protein BDW70DRAFT_133081 [Aspergillus foveolatus]|uniref:uncharacterized protein n=1 Tax=Aspergillus foveolatus TaxID=210207 RepID=UPI003CCCB925